jgi:protein-S-isoprenylcysteine O-methyltransferase Ste14
VNRRIDVGWVGIVGLAIGLGIAAYGLGRYEAWWTVAFAIGGVGVAIADFRRVRTVPAVIAGIAIAVSVAVGLLGVFLVVMSPLARGDGIPLLSAGLGALLVAAVSLVVTVRYARRSTPPSKTEPSTG